MEWSVKAETEEAAERAALLHRIDELERQVANTAEWLSELADDFLHRTAGVIPINDYRPQEAIDG